MDESTSQPNPNARPGAVFGEKRTLLLSAAVLTAGLAIFLAAFPPGGDSGKKGRNAREGRSSNPSATERGNADRGFSPVGGEDRKPAREKGEAWWYRDNAPAGKGKEADSWWYRDKPAREKADKVEKPSHGEAGTAPETGRKAGKPAKAAEKVSGPDEYWWRD